MKIYSCFSKSAQSMINAISHGRISFRQIAVASVTVFSSVHATADNPYECHQRMEALECFQVLSNGLNDLRGVIDRQADSMEKMREVIDMQMQQISGLERGIEATQKAASTAKEEAIKAQIRQIIRATTGDKPISCKTACHEQTGSTHCITGLGGYAPYDTYGCEAAPPGNLICLCLSNF